MRPNEAERTFFLGKIIATNLCYTPIQIYYSLANSSKRNLNLDTLRISEGVKEANPS